MKALKLRALKARILKERDFKVKLLKKCPDLNTIKSLKQLWALIYKVYLPAKTGYVRRLKKEWIKN